MVCDLNSRVEGACRRAAVAVLWCADNAVESVVINENEFRATIERARLARDPSEDDLESGSRSLPEALAIAVVGLSWINAAFHLF